MSHAFPDCLVRFRLLSLLAGLSLASTLTSAASAADEPTPEASVVRDGTDGASPPTRPDEARRQVTLELQR